LAVHISHRMLWSIGMKCACACVRVCVRSIQSREHYINWSQKGETNYTHTLTYTHIHKSTHTHTHTHTHFFNIYIQIRWRRKRRNSPKLFYTKKSCVLRLSLIIWNLRSRKNVKFLTPNNDIVLPEIHWIANYVGLIKLAWFVLKWYYYNHLVYATLHDIVIGISVQL